MKVPVARVTRRDVLTGMAALAASSALGVGSGRAQTPKIVTLVGVYASPVLLSFVNTSALAWSAKTNEGLLEYDFDLNPKPLLATSWQVAEDGLTYTFKLRQGVKWHDGEDFTSEDVAFSIATQKKLHPLARVTFAQISKIDTPDDHTVVLHLDKPTPFLINALSSAEAPIVPKHLYAEGDDPLTHKLNSAPIGTGPYVFKEFVRGDHAIWDANPHYWNAGSPKIDRLVVKFITDSAARSIAMEKGDVDLGYRTVIMPRDLKRFASLPNIAIEEKGYGYDPPNITALEMNLEDPVLSQLKVRQAIAHCIDRDAICKILYYGYATPTASPVVPALKQFHLDEPSPYPFDIAAAQSLLDEAGLKPGSDGFRANFNLDFIGDDGRLLGEFLRASMAKAGINLVLRGDDPATFATRVYTQRDFQLQILSVGNFFDPQVGVARLYWSKNFIKGVAYSNGSAYSNPDVDKLIEAAAIEIDTDKRVGMWHDIQRAVMKDVPNIALFQEAWRTVSNKRVTGHTVNAEGFESNLSQLEIVA